MPFSRFSDVNLRRVSQREAFRSRFLDRLQESGEHLSERSCALCAKREWVKSLPAGESHVLQEPPEFQGPHEPKGSRDDLRSQTISDFGRPA